MKTLIIKKSKRKGITYLLMSFGLLCFFLYRFSTDKTQYPKGNSFYWIAIALFGLTTLYFIYDFIDKSPLYTITDKGIYQRYKGNITLWKDVSAFECESPYAKYVTPKIAILYDKVGNKILTIDFTDSDISLERMERIIKTRLKQK